MIQWTSESSILVVQYMIQDWSKKKYATITASAKTSAVAFYNIIILMTNLRKSIKY